MIDPITKQKILDTAQILDVVSDFVSLRKRGASYVGLCPFHADRNPSFYVTPSKNICKCFACGEGGTPLNFLMKLEQMSYTEALKYLARKYGIHIEEREQTEDELREANERQSLFVLNEFAARFFHDYLLETSEGQQIGLSYFRERGIRLDTIKLFGLGYAPDEWSHFSDAALHKGFSTGHLLSTGLSSQSAPDKPLVDRFRGRVIFPVYTVSGKAVAFGGRILKKNDKLAKYVNSPQSLIYDKSHQLYGLYQAKRSIAQKDKCYLVEGYLDVLQMTQSGITNVVSSSGTALTVPQIKLIHRFTPNVTVLYDGDAAGIKAALRGIDLLLAEGMHVKVVLLPDGEDPDSYAKAHTTEDFVAFLNANEQDFINFKTDLLLKDTQDDPMQRAKVISDIVHSIAMVPDAINRSVYVQATSQRLGMPEDLLLREVGKRRSGASNAISPPLNRPQPAVAHPAATTDKATKSNEGISLAPRKDEIELIRLIFKHGGSELALQDNEEMSTSYEALALFVYNELMADDILDFATPLVRQIIEESAEALRKDSHCDLHSLFVNHPQAEIGRLALDLTAAPYRLSNLLKPDKFPLNEQEKEAEAKKRQKRLTDRTIQAIQIFQNAFVMKRINDLQQRIITAQREHNSELVMQLLAELQELNEIKASFAQVLGERIIL